MPTYLSRLIEYNTWANWGLLDFLDGMGPETLDLTSTGVYGTIRETFEHLLTSEVGYQRRLAGLPSLRADRPTRASRTD